MTLGEKLSKLRKENNYTQEQLADVLGVSRQAISKWESNVRFPLTVLFTMKDVVLEFLTGIQKRAAV